jgi:ArsR family transcriptional regulator
MMEMRGKPAMHTSPRTTAEAGDEPCNVIHAEAVHRVRRVRRPDHLIAQLGELFSALGDGTRLRIIEALMESELCVCDLGVALGLSQSAVSHQLRLLRHLGLVRARRVGRVVYYALDDDHVRRFFGQGLEHVAHGRGGHAAREGA